MVTLSRRILAAVCGLFATILTLGSSPAQAADGNGLQLFVESGIRHSARAVAVSHDGRLIATSSIDRVINIWDAGSGQELLKLPVGSMTLTMAFLPGDRRVAGSQEDGWVSVWDITTGERITALQCSRRSSPPIAVDREHGLLLCADPAEGIIHRWPVDDLALFGPLPITISPRELERAERAVLPPPLPVTAGRIDRVSYFSSDGRYLTLAGPKDIPRIYDVSKGRVAADWPDANTTASFDVSAKAGRIVGVSEPAGPLVVWSWSGRGAPRLLRTDTTYNVHAAAFSPNGRRVVYAMEAGDVVQQVTDTGAETRRFTSRANRIDDAGLSGKLLEIVAWPASVLRALDLKDGGWAGRPQALPLTGERPPRRDVVKLEVPPFDIDRHGDRIDVLRHGAVLASVTVLDKNETWVVTTSEGRFDTNADLSDIKGVHWILGGRPLSPLPLEILMRDYYEPRLLPRLLRGAALPALRAVGELNQAQPRVTLAPPRAGANSDEVVVRLRARPSPRGTGAGHQPSTAAYDLRLFRDGQLVARWPNAEDGGDDALAGWRTRWRIAGEHREAVVKIPTGQLTAPVVFTAYAFNEDRVKSATARVEYRPAAPVAKRPGKAYVVTIGVNGYEASERDLSFAVRDADAMAAALSGLHDYDVVPISLTSEADPATWRATRGNIREVLSRLAGAAPTLGTLAGVLGAEKLARATPDDLVIVTFSGHGYADEVGGFYLLPSDSGHDLQITAASLPAFISSRDLAAWLRPIDAGQLALIIDACHSAGVVDAPGFKPGPMGDRGLGQLAYDKAMRVLAASQADNVALESASLQQGLLTYALREGLERTAEGWARADDNHDGNLTLAEWLRYGEHRTPGVYEDIRAGRLKPVIIAKTPALGSKDPIVSGEIIATQAQTPTLFDFARVRTEVSLGTSVLSVVRAP